MAKESSSPQDDEAIAEVLGDTLRDLLSAERQLVKALPKMAQAARSQHLKAVFLNHLEETEIHVDRLTQALKILGITAHAKPCKGMQGLVEEGPRS